ncbi:molybdenum cofactor biosysynthesis protein [Aliiroseovarius zhejiangensis]|uniref:Molybdenum cofactor biosysynthesis protein n=1 Tax=Aliiroseovarius zhejiangensis TaxID=1632025 RepID=A0ABQ3J426_9RHOB|nr:MOSC N-terminal beta barrel domain-containing protein [Aliiroseovarius zhejiangensis]GHF00848.1 molybdenum cofactor biosysynthesis protein [Aliiroseovarius zhejiangensis]
MAYVAEIWRHPIKSHGREALLNVTLRAGECLPFDRHWAVAHDAARIEDPDQWASCSNFSRGAKAPLLMALDAQFDRASNTITLTHPAKPGITFNPDRLEDHPRFIEWITPLCPTNRAAPARIVKADRGMTDTGFPSVSLINLASHAAVEAQIGQALSPLRWRGNLCLAGLSAWDEKGWIGKRIRVGEIEMDIREEITRCLATTANPNTGERDADTLGALEQGWGHQEFGVYGYVTKPGAIHIDSPVEVIK